MNQEEIVLGVRECVAQVVARNLADVHVDDRIIGDLGADSLDLLDLVFSLEQRFKVKISPRGIEKAAQERLGDIPLEVDGVYTPQALAELRQALPEIPLAELGDGLRVGQLPHLFRVATFVRLVDKLLQAKAAQEGGQAG